MLLEAVSHKGFWWVPGSGLRVPGTLDYKPEDGVRLILNGSLEPTDSHSFGGGERTYDVVHGTTSLGKEITLLDCAEVNWTISVGNDDAYSESTYLARLAFVGELFSTAKDIRLDTMYVGVPNLTPFIGTTGIGPGPEPTTPSERNLTIHPAEEFAFSIGKFHVETFHQQAFERPTLNRISITEEAILSISADTPCPLEEFLDGPIRSMHTLLELVCDGPLPVSELRGQSSAKNDITILRSQRRPRPVDELSHPGMMPFTMKSLAGRCGEVFGRWHTARETFGPTFDLYFSVMRNAEMPVEHQFLFLVQAVETFHRRTGVNYVDDPQEHENRIVETLFSVPARLHEWLCGVIGDHGNEPRLVHRLRAVYDMMPDKIQELFGDKKRFARRITDTRNYFTHFDEGLRSRALVGLGELWGANQQLSAMLKMLFINTLCLDQKAVLETVWGNHMLLRLQQASKNIHKRNG